MARKTDDEKLESIYNKVEEYPGENPAKGNCFCNLVKTSAKPGRIISNLFLS